MKRTCKTCNYYDTYGSCWNQKCDFLKPKKNEDQACAAWYLASRELMSAMCASVDKAREKHPVFLDVWPKPVEAEVYETDAKFWKKEIARKEFDQLRSVLFSEVNEFLAEVARGDFDRAIDEAGDVLSVIYRVLNGDGQKKEEKND